MMMIISVIGGALFLFLGVVILLAGNWLPAAWSLIVAAAFVDWGRRIVLKEDPGSVKGASLRAGVLMLLSVFAAIEIPQYLHVQEKVKFNNAVRWITAVDLSENQALLRKGKYSDASLSSDDALRPLEDFTVDVSLSTGALATWAITLHRKPSFTGHCPVFDCYTVTYRSLPGATRLRNGDLPGRFVCSNSSCTESLLPY
jgi:hypothetical protein